MPKIVDYEKIKDDIASKAVDVFVAQGYYETTLADVASKCGIGRTTIYSYFKNKEDIFFYALRREFELFLSQYASLLEATDLSNLEKIKSLITTIIENQEKHPVLVIFTELWLLLQEKEPWFESAVRRRLGEIRLMFRDLIKEGVATGEIKPIDHDAMSSVLFGLVEGMFLEKLWNKNMKMDAHLHAIGLLLDGLKL